MKTIHIVVVEDNDTMRLGIMESLRREGYLVTDFNHPTQALDFIRKSEPDLVISDLKMEPMDGLTLLRSIKETKPQLEVLLISAYGTIDVAVKAMREGAVDFLTKPFSPEELRVRVNKIAEKVIQKEKLERLRAENLIFKEHFRDQYENIIGQSPVMQDIFTIIDKVADQDSSILIEGESGTGKELVARAIHNRSSRRDQPFIRVNCGALNENLLESELFGHEKGSFTGAIRQKRGRFELADGGTLFLDEIGDISPNMQIKLLRVLQEQEFERVGGELTLKVDVRIISATNKDLRAALKEDRFREDLFYRLSVIPIKIPPLRDRKEDIPLLAEYFLQKMAQNRKYQKRSLHKSSLDLLKRYPWPGNIRELENVIERLVVISPYQEILPALTAQHLGFADKETEIPINQSLEKTLQEYERNLLIKALKEAKGVKNRAAKILGIRTSTLYYKLQKFGLIE